MGTSSRDARSWVSTKPGEGHYGVLGTHRGAKRIRDELARLGYEVAKSTVEEYMVRRHGPPSPTWRAFLRENAREIIACDFFTIPTATFRSITGFVFLDHARRRVLAIGATPNPSAEWAVGLVRRAVLAGGRQATHLLRDRDGIYGNVFRDACRNLGLAQVVSARRAPRQNALVERVIGSIRRECLDHRIILGPGHAERVLAEYATYYNLDRPHQALGSEPPVVGEDRARGSGPIVAEPRLGRLHHTYRRAA